MHTSGSVLCPRCRRPARRRARFCSGCSHDLILNNAGPCYYLTRLIKQGGQGAVYAASGEDGRAYAVKELLDQFTDPQERAAAVERFGFEARLLTFLDHPQLPKVYSYFQDENRHYLVMDLIHGEDLEQIIDRQGAQPEVRVLDWAGQICDALAFLHERGLVYRDVKPSNIMLDQRAGGIKLVDFSLAKILLPGTPGTKIGTPGYAPPEQYQGLTTQQSDVYALGATLHHLLSGADPAQRQPFFFPPLRDLRPEISQRTADAIARAVQLRPADRFQSIAELRAALDLPAASSSRAPAPVGGTRQPQPAGARTRMSTIQRLALQRYFSRGPLLSQRIKTRLLGCLVKLVLAVCLLPVLFLCGILPGDRQQPTPTPASVIWIRQPFTVTDLELNAPAAAGDAELRAAFIRLFEHKARQQFGEQARVQPNTISYIDGPPQRVGRPATSPAYRASLRGVVLVPQPIR